MESGLRCLLRGALVLCLPLFAGCSIAPLPPDGEQVGNAGSMSGDAEPEVVDAGTIPPQGNSCSPDGGSMHAWCPSSNPSNRLIPFPIRGTAVGGNAVGTHGCKGQYSHYEHRTDEGPQLHVISVYGGAAGTDGKKHVQVKVNRSGSSILVLSAYEETSWTVSLTPGAVVERIIANGYHAQSVSAPSGIPVEIHGYEQTGRYFGTGAEWPSYGSTLLVNALEAHVGRELTSFRGCGESSTFEIDAPGELRPPHRVSSRRDATLPAACAQLATESTYCMSMGSGAPIFFGLDSGRVCSGVPMNTSVSSHSVSSLAWLGDYAYACLHGRGLARISLMDGTVDIAPIACEAVSTHRDGLLVMLGYGSGSSPESMGAVIHFDSFAAAVRREPSCWLGIRPHATRMAVHGDRGYFAWHSTGTLSTTLLGPQSSMQELKLEGYDGWVFGMDATDDGRLLILGPGGASEPRLFLFDRTTGASLGAHPVRLSSMGLACVSRYGGM